MTRRTTQPMIAPAPEQGLPLLSSLVGEANAAPVFHLTDDTDLLGAVQTAILDALISC